MTAFFHEASGRTLANCGLLLIPRSDFSKLDALKRVNAQQVPAAISGARLSSRAYKPLSVVVRMPLLGMHDCAVRPRPVYETACVGTVRHFAGEGQHCARYDECVPARPSCIHLNRSDVPAQFKDIRAARPRAVLHTGSRLRPRGGWRPNSEKLVRELRIRKLRDRGVQISNHHCRRKGLDALPQSRFERVG